MLHITVNPNDKNTHGNVSYTEVYVSRVLHDPLKRTLGPLEGPLRAPKKCEFANCEGI